MLTKLLKFEFKETARIIPFLYLVTLLIAAVSIGSSRLNLGFVKTTSSAILIVVGIAVLIVTFVVIAVRFYHNLYSNEGYLMFTLPVKPQKLLASKGIVAFCWILASVAVFIGSLLLGLYSIGVDLSELSEIRSEIIKLGLEKVVIIAIPIFILIAIIYFISQIYFAITVGNFPCFHGMGVAGSFISFLVTYITLKIFETIFAIFVPLALTVNLEGSIETTISMQNMFNYFVDAIKGIAPNYIVIGLGGYIFDIIMIFVLTYFTGRIMNRKVSLK